MGDADPYPLPGLPPEVLVFFVLLGTTSLLAAVLFVFLRKPRSNAPFRPILPHPSQPLSMLVFVGLPAFLFFIRLILLVPGVMTPIDLVNSPQSYRRIADVPVGLSVYDWDSPQRYAYPPNAAELTAQAGARIGRGSRQERAQAVRDLAWWTAVCPNYAPFTLPRLAAALQDPDVRVRSTVVTGLRSLGAHALPAVPDLVAARGSSVAHFDHLLNHAVHVIEREDRWPPEDVCEDVSREEFERLAVQRGVAADGAL